MGLFTLYNVVSSIPAAQFQRRLSDQLEPLELVAEESLERDDGSQLVLLQRVEASIQLGLWIIPLAEGQFQPATFDERADETWAGSIRTLCKVGAERSPDPAATVLTGLALAAGLIEEQGRVYDVGLARALARAEAQELSTAPFDIRSFVTYHYLAPPGGEAAHSWLHLHGMAKFFSPDLEAFDVPPEVSHKALALLMHLATRAARGEPLPVEEPMPYGHGAILLRDGEKVRPLLPHFAPEDISAHHEGPTLVLEDAGVYRSLDKLLRGAYELEPKTRAECEAERQVWQVRLEAIRAAWSEQSDPLMIRAALEVGPDKAVEHIWLTIESWQGTTITGRLLNDAFAEPEMNRGSTVELQESAISGLSITRGDEALDELETLRRIELETAAALDAALDVPAPTGPLVESERADGDVVVHLVDDGVVGALLLLDRARQAPLSDPIWLYNRRPTPPILDLRRLTQRGLAPLLSVVYTAQRQPSEAPQTPAPAFSWEGATVKLELDGVLWAVLDTASGVGWSRLITRRGRFGRPLNELEQTNEATSDPLTGGA